MIGAFVVAPYTGLVIQGPGAQKLPQITGLTSAHTDLAEKLVQHLGTMAYKIEGVGQISSDELIAVGKAAVPHTGGEFDVILAQKGEGRDVSPEERLLALEHQVRQLVTA